MLNSTLADYPRDTTIHQLFEGEAERTPEQVVRCIGRQALDVC